MDLYPAYEEFYQQPLQQFFSGFNLTYKTQQPFQVYNYFNYLNEYDLEETPISYAQTSLSIAYISDTNKVYNSSLPDIKFNKIDLLYSTTEIHCYSLVYINSSTLLVDCQDHWQLIYNNQLPFVISNHLKLDGIPKLVYSNNTIYRGVLNNQNASSIYIYNLKNLSNYLTSKEFENLVDFTIDSDILYVLLLSKINQCNQSQDNNQLKCEQSFKTHSNNNTGFHVQNNQVVIANNEIYNNLILNYITESAMEQIKTYSSGQPFTFPTLICRTFEFILIQNQFHTLIFETQLEHPQNSQIENIFSLINIQGLLQFTTNKLKVGFLSIPYLYLNQTDRVIPQRGNISVMAISYSSRFNQTCQLDFRYQLIPPTAQQLYQIKKNINVPQTALYPQNLKFNVGQYYSGPLKQFYPQIEGPSTIEDTTIQLLFQGEEINDQTFGKMFYFNNNTFLLCGANQTNIVISLCNDVCKKINVYQIEYSINDMYFYQDNFFIFQSSPTQLVQCEYDQLQNPCKILYNSTFNQSISSFNLINTAVYIIIQTLNIIDIINLQTNELSVLSILNLTSKSFMPLQILGEEQNANVLYVNNYYECIILYNYVQVNQITYPLQKPNMNTQVTQIQGYLIFTQSSGDQFLITQWNAKKISQVQFIKNLQTYGTPAYPLAQQDYHFFYLKIQNGIYIYNPTVSTHQALYQFIQFDFIYFSSLPLSEQSIILIGNSSVTQIYSIKTYQEIVVTTNVSDYSQYYTQTNYQIYVNTYLNLSNSYNISSELIIYNAQLDIYVNQTQQPSEMIVNSLGENVIDIYPQLYIRGDVVEYQVNCLQNCNKIQNLNIINYLTPLQSEDLTEQEQKDLKIDNIEAMGDYGYQTLIQTLSEIYIVNQVGIRQEFTSFTKAEQCPLIWAGQQRIVSLCIYKWPTIRIYNANNQQLLGSQVMKNYLNPKQCQIVADQLFLLAQQQFNYYNIYTFKIDYENDTMLTLNGKISATKPILSFAIGNLWQFKQDQDIYNQHVIFFTSGSQLNRMSLLQKNNRIEYNNYSEIIELSFSNYTLEKTLFAQLLIIENQLSNMVTLVVLTNNIMDFVYNITFKQVESITPQSLTLENITIVTTLPPYGLWETVQGSFTQGILVLEYRHKSNIGILALFDLHDLNDIYNTTLMVGGYYVNSNMKPHNFVFQIQSSTYSIWLIFYTNLNQGLETLIVQHQLQLVFTLLNKFTNAQLELVAQNDYLNRSVNFTVLYQPIHVTVAGLRWWVWLIIALGLLFLSLCVTVIIVKLDDQEIRQQEFQLPIFDEDDDNYSD